MNQINLVSSRFQIDPETLNFGLPKNLVAQEPLRNRDQARLLVLNRRTGETTHRVFSDLTDYLNAGDVLVLNKAKVSKAKLVGRKHTGGKVEVIFLGRVGSVWRALVRPLLKVGARFSVGNNFEITVKAREASGEYQLEVDAADLESFLEKAGLLPLPPYIKRGERDPRVVSDQVDYQTVYASVPGSVAAPTAGLHFSENLLERLKKQGVNALEILLHVGWGTFRSIAGPVEKHLMLPEKFELSPEVYAELMNAKKENRRIMAVGTTVTRTLESLDPSSLSGETTLFIRPGFRFRWTHGLITNLHVPRSTPIALTAAFAGIKNLERAYEEAIQQEYRFYSYGDAMLIL